AWLAGAHPPRPRPPPRDRGVRAPRQGGAPARGAGESIRGIDAPHWPPKQGACPDVATAVPCADSGWAPPRGISGRAVLLQVSSVPSLRSGGPDAARAGATADCTAA